MKHYFKIKLAILALITMVFAGCAPLKKAPISAETTQVNTAAESIAFMTVKVRNQKNGLHQPVLKHVDVRAETDQLDYRTKILPPISEVKGLGKEFLVSFQVRPGIYTIEEIFARSFSFPVVGWFEMPINYRVSIPANSVVYLGHLDSIIVDKTASDLPAGPLVPLLDQAVAGASTGTFKIKIEDNYNQDVEYIKKTYPIFKSIDIKKILLSDKSTLIKVP